MHPVGNQAGCHARMIKRRPHQPRTARVGLAHGVEQMRCHAGTGVEGAHGGVIVAIAMAQRHQHARLRQRRDLIGGGVFGGEGHHQVRDPGHGICQHRHISVRQGADQAAVMGTFAGNAQMRPFKVEPRDTRHAQVQRLCHGGDGGAAMGGGVGDQRGKKCAGAKSSVRGGHGVQCVQIGRAIEHRAAPAVNLQIHKPGGEDAPVQPPGFGPRRQRGQGCDARDAVGVHHKRVTGQQIVPVKNARAGIGGERCGHARAARRASATAPSSARPLVSTRWAVCVSGR